MKQTVASFLQQKKEEEQRKANRRKEELLIESGFYEPLDKNAPEVPDQVRKQVWDEDTDDYITVVAQQASEEEFEALCMYLDEDITEKRGMFSNVGKKIRGVAIASFVISLIAAIIGGFVLLLAGEDLALIGLLVLCGGIMTALIGAWLLYGYGELIGKVSAIERHLKQTKQ